MAEGVLVVETDRGLDETGETLTRAIVDRKFGVIAVQDLEAIMAKKEVVLGRGCRVYEVCNPHQAKRVMDSDMSISSALPCRISIYEEDGKTKMATILPSLLLSAFDQHGLAEVADEVETVMVESMREAASA